MKYDHSFKDLLLVSLWWLCNITKSSWQSYKQLPQIITKWNMFYKRVGRDPIHHREYFDHQKGFTMNHIMCSIEILVNHHKVRCKSKKKKVSNTKRLIKKVLIGSDKLIPKTEFVKIKPNLTQLTRDSEYKQATPPKDLEVNQRKEFRLRLMTG